MPQDPITIVDLELAPPAGFWTMLATHDTCHMVLPLAGRRSIFTKWPPEQFCAGCGRLYASGYVGHAYYNRVHFPSELLQCLCEACARSILELEPGELTGHRCVERCTDRLHLEHITAQEAEELSRAVASTHRIVAELRDRGWRIADMTRPNVSRRTSDTQVALWIEPLRRLPWSSVGDSCDRWVL